VHGRRVIKPNEFPAQVSEVASLPEADGVMSIAPHQAVWVCSADCTPVLIADAQTGQVAAVHAGWRGTALGIVPEAIRLMIAQGSQVADLRVALGPAIAGEVYQVTTHVAAEVGRSLTMTSEDDDTLIAALQDMALPPILPDPEPGRVRLDVRRVNVLQLQQMGLDPEQIEIAPHCTYQEPEQFFSYRRTYEKKVQWSGIVSV
jgi:YfiH family protein